MSKTAVALFENSALAEQVARELEASAFPRNDIRILREPLDMDVSGAMSTPHADFELGLERELRGMGATVAEANAYAQGLRKGGVLVFATGSDQQVEQAAEIMNTRGAAEVEKLVGREPYKVLAAGEDTPFTTDSSTQTGRIRDSGSGGVRVFVW